MAWRENASGHKPGIAEISCEIAPVAENGQTAWKVHWLDGAGKPVRDFEVAYGGGVPAQGVDFYRSVARSMLGSAKGGGATAAELSKQWWAGAEMAGDSRAESLRAAFTLDPKPPENAPRLAGLLAHAALPSLGGAVSLDGVLLARAAAWLAVAEWQLKAGEKPTDALWAPILFLSGRENTAVDGWKKSPATGETSAEKWWAFMLSRPRAAEVFAFAAQKANRKLAAPLLVYESRCLQLGGVLPRVLRALDPSGTSLKSLSDYGPYFQQENSAEPAFQSVQVMPGAWQRERLLAQALGFTEEQGGTGGAWPVVSRMDWIECMRKFQPEPLDFHGYTEALQKIKAVEPRQAREEDDLSLIGLNDAADLINLGFSEGVGKLTPVAVVTARDLLNFGWELNGVQMFSRWYFLRNFSGDQATANSIAKTTLANIDGAEVFLCPSPFTFDAARPPETWRYIRRARVTDSRRLQDLDSPAGSWAAPMRAFDTGKPQNARLWLRRCWLNGTLIGNQCREHYFSNLRDEIAPDLTRWRAEGGPRLDAQLLEFFIPTLGLDAEGLVECPGTAEVLRQLIDSRHEPHRPISVSYARLDVLNKPFENAQALEKLFWQRPGDDPVAGLWKSPANANLYDRIFCEYVRAHAYDSAKRFYRQAEPLVKDQDGFIEKLAVRRFALAVLENDKPAMTDALRASATKSFAGTVMNAVAHAIRGDARALEKEVNESIERYGDYGMMQKLKGFLPLLPALKDSRHRDHGKALDYFGSYNQWPTMQWVLAQEAKLSPEDAVRFLGGPSTDLERRFFVAYLLKDKLLFRQTYQEFEKERRRENKEWQTMAFVAVHHLHNQLFELPAPPEEPDLKPAGVKSLQEVFRENLK